VLGASPLTDHDRELLILRIGWNCQAEYEWAKHVGSVGRARDHGLEPQLIAQGPGADGWSPFSVTLLILADELYRDAAVSNETWDAITTDFDTRETISALMTVSTYRLVSMSLNAFGVQILETDEGLPDIP
jgi:alkylhydroperoxidase family enzyme